MKNPLLTLWRLTATLLLVATIAAFALPSRPTVARRGRTRSCLSLQSYRLADLAATCSCNAVFGNPASRQDWSEMASRLDEESEAAERREQLDTVSYEDQRPGR